MTSARDCHHRHPKMFSTGNMKLTSSASEQNVYFTYVCLVDDINPTAATSEESDKFDKAYNLLSKKSDLQSNQHEAPAIEVGRTKALYELVESSNRATQSSKAIGESDSSTAYPTTTSGEENDSDTEKDNTFISCDNPNILKLTKMKWLSEDPNDSGADSSSPSLSSITSNTSTCSKNSDGDVINCGNLNDKYLSTILRLDKEHNMFGLSSIAIIGPHTSKQKRAKDDERAVFHQTAIVQVCCSKRCCRYISKTDLPGSLKCGNSCRTCCFNPPKCGTPCRSCCYNPPKCGSCVSCSVKTCGSCAFGPPYCGDPCTVFCRTCSKTSCASSCKRPIPPSCKKECCESTGLKIKVNRKPVYDPPVVQLTPRNSSVLQKPFISRTCSHTPECIGPSDCFPYLMPCFWPASPSSPCSDPARCFHTPPCPPPRIRQRAPLPNEYVCPKGQKCTEGAKNAKCLNEICPGNNASMRQAIESRFGAAPATGKSTGASKSSGASK